MFAALLAAAVVSALVETAPRAASPAASAGLLADGRELLSHRLFLGPTLVLLCALAGVMAWITNSAFVLIRGFGVSPSAYSLMYALVIVITSYSIHYTKLYDRCPTVTDAGPRSSPGSRSRSQHRSPAPRRRASRRLRCCASRRDSAFRARPSSRARSSAICTRTSTPRACFRGSPWCSRFV